LGEEAVEQIRARLPARQIKALLAGLAGNGDLQTHRETGRQGDQEISIAGPLISLSPCWFSGVTVQRLSQVQTIDRVNQIEQCRGAPGLVALKMADQMPADRIPVDRQRGDLRLGLLHAVLAKITQVG